MGVLVKHGLTLSQPIGINAMAKKWYYNSRSGIVDDYEEVTMVLALHTGVGWHGPFDTKEAALKYYTDNAAKNTGWQAPTESVGAGVANLGNTAANATLGKLGLSDQDIQSWLVRVGEILLGIVLIGVGIAKLTGTTNAVAKVVKARI